MQKVLNGKEQKAEETDAHRGINKSIVYIKY